MKTILYFSILCLSLIGCKDDTSNNNIDGQHLSVNSIKEYLPESYFEESVFIFTNKDSNELKLLNIVNESVKERTWGNSIYKTDQFEVHFYDPLDLFFELALIGSTNFNDEGKVSVGLTGLLEPGNPRGGTWNSIHFDNEKPVIGFGVDYHKNILLNNKEFKDVFIRIGRQGMEQHSAYSELDINSEFGIVAFRDDKNELWVFDRIER